MKSPLLALSAIFVSLTVSGCRQAAPPEPIAINRVAALSGQLPYNPLSWRVITTWTNPKNGTLSILFGNDSAVDYARSHNDCAYPAGSVLSLVTWSERDDPHWFGARIPAPPQSVEFVTIGTASIQATKYQRFEDSPLKEVIVPAEAATSRTDYLLAQRAAVIP